MCPGRAAVTTPALYPASPFVLRRAEEVRSNSPKTGSKSLSVAGMLPSSGRGHTAVHKGKHWGLLRRGLVGCDTPSLRKRMCAFTAYVRFLRRRGPAGLRNLFFGYSVVIFASPCSLSLMRKQLGSNGWTQRSLKFAKNGLKFFSGVGYYRPLKNRTQRLTGANTEYFCAGGLGNIASRRNQMCTYDSRSFSEPKTCIHATKKASRGKCVCGKAGIRLCWLLFVLYVFGYCRTDIISPLMDTLSASTFSAASIASLIALPTRATPHCAAKERYNPLYRQLCSASEFQTCQQPVPLAQSA